MATTFTLEIASGYAANTDHTIQVFQGTTLLGTATATVSTAGKATFVSASVTLSGHSAGLVTVSSYDGNDTLTNNVQYTIDASGAILDGTVAANAATAATEIGKVKRSASAVAAGASVTETRTTVSDTESELIETVEVT